jgi:lipopolysaccharide/colanic/teichoic acid biosynthesis glycosyltransferase
LVTLAATSELTAQARGATRAQRCFDLMIGILALPVIAVIGALIAIAIYVDSPGPVIYRSRRVGKQGRPFDMLKFRKMRREAGSQPITLEEDERFTPIGRFLAATRLDELPQVWNVLRGEMRLVGPRPELECFVAEFAEEYAQILTVVPGITGPSQIRFVDERHLLTGEDPETTYRTHVLPLKIKLDLQYARSHSLIGDLGIILSTVVLPVRLLLARLRSPGMRLALWIPAAAAALALALVFLLTSSHLS